MQIIVNGDSLETQATNLTDLLEELDLLGVRIAVELNRQIIPKSQHPDTSLSHGDKIEIVHAIGGG